MSENYSRRVIQHLLDHPEIDRVWIDDLDLGKVQIVEPVDPFEFTGTEDIQVLCKRRGWEKNCWVYFVQQGPASHPDDIADFSVGMEEIIGDLLDEMIDHAHALWAERDRHV